MEVRGFLTYCDRCGFKIFRKAERKGYPNVDLWVAEEDLPEGWTMMGHVHLCQKCSEAWNKFISDKEDKK